MAWAMLGPIYALFVEDLGWDLMDASIALGLFALSAWVTTVLSGRFSDSLNNKVNVLAFWYLIMWIWFLLYMFVDSIMFLFVVQVIIWLGEAIYSPAFDALYWSNIHKKQRWFEWWIWESMNYFTISAWSFIWGVLVTLFWFKIMFLVMCLMCMWWSLLLFFWPKGIYK